MRTFLFRCPNTGYRVQGFLAEETDDTEAYEGITCTACQRTLLVNPMTGKVLGQDDD